MRRTHLSAIDAFQPSHFDFLRCRRRREVFIQKARLGFRDVAFGKTADDEALLASEWAADEQFVAGADLAIRVAGLTVDVDLASLAGLLRFRPGAEQTGDVEPDVETHAFTLPDSTLIQAGRKNRHAH
jgi:hypothetical protein